MLDCFGTGKEGRGQEDEKGSFAAAVCGRWVDRGGGAYYVGMNAVVAFLARNLGRGCLRTYAGGGIICPSLRFR